MEDACGTAGNRVVMVVDLVPTSHHWSMLGSTIAWSYWMQREGCDE